MVAQRIRVAFCRSGAIRFISHLDMMRMWHRVFRRADIQVAYSEGSTPRPRFSLAAPLAVGVTSEGELMDVFLRRRLSPFFFIKKIGPQLPFGIEVMEAEDIPIDWPSLQSQVERAEYRVTVETTSAALMERAIEGLLKRETIPWEHHREKQVRRYDLRNQIHDLWLESEQDGQVVVGMVLKTDPTGSGRPDQVVTALDSDLDLVTVHRLRLYLSERSRGRKHGKKLAVGVRGGR